MHGTLQWQDVQNYECCVIMRIIYFPGFGGNENSKMYSAIKNDHWDTKIISYNNFDAIIAHEEISEQLDSIIQEKTLIIGQSLGGFWAHIKAIKYNKSVILINPSLRPHVSLAKYNLSEAQLCNYAKFEELSTSKNKITIILSKDDDVVDPTPVIAKYRHIAKFKYISGGHRVSDYTTIISSIREYDEKL